MLSIHNVIHNTTMINISITCTQYLRELFSFHLQLDVHSMTPITSDLQTTPPHKVTIVNTVSVINEPITFRHSTSRLACKKLAEIWGKRHGSWSVQLNLSKQNQRKKYLLARGDSRRKTSSVNLPERQRS